MSERFARISGVSHVPMENCPLAICLEDSALLCDKENDGNNLVELKFVVFDAMTKATIKLTCLGERGQVVQEITHDIEQSAKKHDDVRAEIDLGCNDVKGVMVAVVCATLQNGKEWAGNLSSRDIVLVAKVRMVWIKIANILSWLILASAAGSAVLSWLMLDNLNERIYAIVGSMFISVFFFVLTRMFIDLCRENKTNTKRLIDIERLLREQAQEK